jgi:alkaline phosphatase
VIFSFAFTSYVLADDWRRLQTEAVTHGHAVFGHWGPDGTHYSSWTSHSNRLIPVYTFGMDLCAVRGANSVYRNDGGLRELFGDVPEGTLNPDAEYFDQTDVYRLQKMAADAGKKYIVLMIFDGMDWQLTQLGAIAKSHCFTPEGRGSGLYLFDYQGAPSDYGFMVTSPHNEGTKSDVNQQTVLNPGGELRGGYDAAIAGAFPWSIASDPLYPIGKGTTRPHAYTDSSSSATSMTAGAKIYNNGVNVEPFGRQVPTIAHQLQSQGFAIGVVTSVPISHATPACAYAHNVDRDDYQDLTRDMVGLPSIAHPSEALPGVDVLIGAGWGDEKMTDASQGQNFVAGNRYLTADDRAHIDAANGGAFEVALREAGANGRDKLLGAAEQAVAHKKRLIGMFGQPSGHLPFRTADGGFDPTISVGSDGNPKDAEQYTSADLLENPTLTDMTNAALHVLPSRSDKFWLMVEAGDVDWAAHANNIDNAAGAVISGDDAFHAIVDWIEQRHAWNEAAVIVTSDHGHYFVFDDAAVLLRAR